MRTGTAELVDQLLPYVRPFAGMAAGGRWSFQLLCSVRACRRLDTISATRHRLGSDRHRRMACEKFVRQGWLFGDGPVCPSCRGDGRADPGAAADRGLSGE